jgi:NAD(P)-dependent dehydrogenase (short-subunit alcohol dehydrogenase family)
MGLAMLTGVGREGQVGEAVAARLAADGHELLLVDRSLDGVSARAAALRASGASASGYAADLTYPEAVTGLFERIRKSHGPGLDALVHMAGGFASTGTVAETDVADWDRQLDINLRTAFLTAKAALPLLRDRRGAIVFFSSEAALAGAKLSHIAAYAVAKNGVSVLASAIAEEEQPSGVRVNVLAPAAIRTAANVESMPEGSRFVERQDVAAAVSWLCSDEAAGLTGQVLRLAPR